MKKILVLIMSMNAFGSFAQNVGIGTTTPQERLHVIQTANLNKNVIYAYANQTSSTLDYENTAITGFGQGNGVLPFYGYGIGLKGIGSINSYGAIGVYAALATDIPEITTPLINTFYAFYADVRTPGANRFAGVFLNGNVGIGTATPADKLDISGNVNVSGLLKINGNSGTAGQVLVSNGVASPTWQTVANPAIGFFVQGFLPTTIDVPNFITTHISFHSYSGTDFNDGNAFDNASGNFICNSAGTYFFEAQIVWPNISAPVSLEIHRNGAMITSTQDKLIVTPAPYGQTSRVSCLIKCNLGDVISIYGFQASGAPQSVNNTTATYFSGHKVY